jgi:hypothetical protein
LLLGSAAQGFLCGAYLEYVPHKNPRRTQPSGKKGLLKIKNLAAAYEQHNPNPITVFKLLTGQLITRHKAFVIEHYLYGHIQLTAAIQQDFARLFTASINNMSNQVCHGPVSHLHFYFFAD